MAMRKPKLTTPAGQVRDGDSEMKIVISARIHGYRVKTIVSDASVAVWSNSWTPCAPDIPEEMVLMIVIGLRGLDHA